MSIEGTKESTHNIEKRLSDDKVSLIELACGGWVFLLKVADEADAKLRCCEIENFKKTPILYESRHFDRLPPPTYKVISNGTTIKITGDLDELEDAAEVLQQYHNYISPHKMKQLIHEIAAIHRKIHEATREKAHQERKTKQVKKEKSIRERYAPLVEKYGMDKKIAFESLSNAKTKTSTISSKTPKKKSSLNTTN